MEDSELREAIITYLYANRTTGDGGTPLTLSDANLAIALGAEVDQFNNVLASLIEDGVVHGVPRRVVSTELQMELDCIRLRDDPLPPPDPQIWIDSASLTCRRSAGVQGRVDWP